VDKIKAIPGLLACACLFLSALPSRVIAETSLIEVDLQLVLAADISFSISPDEQDIQRRGYVAAFRDPEVIRTITSGLRGRVAVTYLEWAGEESQAQVVPWSLVYDQASASAFADALERATINRKGRTSLSQALSVALGLFRQSPFVAERHAVDISSDGFNNNGPRVDRLRDALVYHGVTINGLPLMAGKDSGPESFLATYFEDCVIGGPGAFMMPVVRWEEFGQTLGRKLIMEIAGPEKTPATARLVRAADTGPARAKMDCLFGEKQDLKEYIQQLEEAVGKDRAPRWMPREQDWPMPD